MIVPYESPELEEVGPQYRSHKPKVIVTDVRQSPIQRISDGVAQVISGVCEMAVPVMEAYGPMILETSRNFAKASKRMGRVRVNMEPRIQTVTMVEMIEVVPQHPPPPKKRNLPKIKDLEIPENVEFSEDFMEDLDRLVQGDNLLSTKNVTGMLAGFFM